MQFSDTSNLTGLVEDIDFFCNTNSTSYPLKDKARNANRWAYAAVVWILKANRLWEFDDTNQTDLPIATTTLVDSQNDYTLPTNLLKLQRVEVKDASGNYHKLDPIDKSQIKGSVTEFEETDGLPRYYDIVGTSIFLYPAPAAASVTTTAGLKIYYSREIDVFASTDTTQEAGFPEPFHRVISLGAAYDWYIRRGQTQKASSLRSEIEVWKRELISFYESRDEEVKTSLRLKHNTASYI